MAAQHQRATCYSSKRPRHRGHFSGWTKRTNRLTRQRGWSSTETRPRDPVTDRIRNESRTPIERKVQSAPIKEAWVSGLFDGQFNLLSSFGHGQNNKFSNKRALVSNVYLPKKTRVHTHGAICDDTNFISRLKNEPEVHDWIQREESRKRKYGKVMMKPGGPGVSVSLDGTFSRAKRSTKNEPSKRATLPKLATDVISPWKRQSTTTTVFLRRDYQDEFVTTFPIMDLVEPTWPTNVTFPPLRKVDNFPKDLTLRKIDSLPKDASISSVDHMSVDIPPRKLDPLHVDASISIVDHMSVDILPRKLNPLHVDASISIDDHMSVDIPPRKLDPLHVDASISIVDHMSVDIPPRKLDPLHVDASISIVDHMSVDIPPRKLNPLHEDTPFTKVQPIFIYPHLKWTDSLSKHFPTGKIEPPLDVKPNNVLSRRVKKEDKPEETSSKKRGWPSSYNNDVLDQPVKHECVVRYYYGDTRPIYCPVGSVTFRRSVTMVT